jgi:hypothetical protein
VNKTHETITSFRTVEAGSNRKFGLTIGALLSLLSLAPLLHHRAPHLWLLITGLAVLIAGAAFPDTLTWANRAWFRFGLVLNTIASPIVMGLLFFGAMVPIGWLLCRQGKDVLALKLQPDAATYWQARDPSGPDAGTLGKQF